jgi:hypothetical protein
VVLRVLAGISAVAALAHPQAQNSLPTLDDLLARNLKARGGVARLKAVQVMRFEGTMETAGGTEVPTTIYMARPNLIRQEAQVDGRTAVQAFDGRRGWAMNPMMGNSPIEVPGEIARRMADQADFDGPLVDLETKGHRLEMVGPDKAGETPAIKVKLTKKSGEQQFIYFDAATALEIMTRGEVDQEGRALTIESRYSDFRTIDGITLPFGVEVLVNGQRQQKITLSKVEFPSTLDAELFAMPRRR